MDLIDRERLWKDITTNIEDCGELLDILERQPSAEKTGDWIDHQLDRWIYAKCSKCGSVHNVRSNYCPSCGARMIPREKCE